MLAVIANKKCWIVFVLYFPNEISHKWMQFARFNLLAATNNDEIEPFYMYYQCVFFFGFEILISDYGVRWHFGGLQL